jgi:hypothetical protein
MGVGGQVISYHVRACHGMYGPFTGYSKHEQRVHCLLKTTMTEPIPSPSSPINAKTTKTQRQHKGKAKVVSPNSAAVDSVLRTAAHTISSQGSGPAASSDHHDGIIESGDYGDFDYDAVKADDGIELWLVRAPSTVRPRRCFLPFRFSLIKYPAAVDKS